MDAAEPGPGSAASVTLVKAEISDHLAGTSAATSTPGTTGASPAPSALSPGLFTGSSNKRPRTDDWLSPTSPGSPQSQKHLVYTTPQQQINSQQPPLAHSTPLGQTQQAQSQPPNNNGYASPMSSGSYDPYSPNGKIGREDLSPPTSLNGYNANSCDAKKKKGPTPRQQEELCLVCGDRASGYHYNALTCEGCKGFFRRSITKNAVYQCKYGSGCEIDMYMRRKCQECRLKKCLKEGMRPECVVPEYQCAVKRKEKKAQKEKDKPNSTTMNGSPMSLSGSGIEHVSVKTEPMETDSLSSSSNRSVRVETTNNGVKPLSPEQEQLINRVVYFQTVFEHPNQEDVKNIIEQLSNVTDPSDHNYKYITEITMLTVNLVVQFAMRLPGFDQILREDQIALLKASSSEVMMLRMARKYDIDTDSIIFANNQSYTKDSYIMAGLDESIEDLLQFCRQMYTMQVNNAEYALLTAAVIFSERPNLIENKKIEMIQEIYLEALKAYVDNRRKQRGSMMFPKLLSVLTELRTLGYKNSETCDKLKLKNKQLPPFLAEIWDK